MDGSWRAPRDGWKVLLIVAWAASHVTLAAAAPPVAQPLTKGSAPTLLMSQVPASAAARLRGVGLDPGDPNLAAKLRGRREALHRTVLARTKALTFTPVRTLRDKVGIVKQPTSTPARPETTTATARMRSDVTRLTATLGTLKVVDVYQLKSTRPAPSPLPLGTALLFPLIDLSAPLPSTLDQFGTAGGDYVPTLSVSSPACSFTETIDAKVHYAWFPPLLFLGSSYYQQSLGLAALSTTGHNLYYVQSPLGSADRLLGATPRPATLTIWVPGFGQGSLAVTIPASPQQVTGSLDVGADPPTVGNNPFGVADANSILGGNGARANAGPPWGGQSGDDILGRGIALGPGYTATASIVASYSQADLEGQNPPANAYRSATVTGQPSSGRLETVVHWTYQAGESLAYSLQWQLSGPAGQRAVLTMPLSGPCDS